MDAAAVQEQYEGRGGGGVGVFGRPCLGAGGQDGSVALAQLYLVDHGMFIFFTPFSLQKIPAFSRPFFFFSFFFLPTTLLKAKK